LLALNVNEPKSVPCLLSTPAQGAPSEFTMYLAQVADVLIPEELGFAVIECVLRLLVPFPKTVQVQF